MHAHKVSTLDETIQMKISNGARHKISYSTWPKEHFLNMLTKQTIFSLYTKDLVQRNWTPIDGTHCGVIIQFNNDWYNSPV